MAKLLAADENFVVGGKKAIHGADRAVVDALVEQGGVEFQPVPDRQSGANGADRAQFAATLPATLWLGWAVTAERSADGIGVWCCVAGWRATGRALHRWPETVPLTGIADANPFGQGVLSRTISGAIGANWIPSRSASFFWTSMIAPDGAGAGVFRKWASEAFCAEASSVASGWAGRDFGPRLAGVSQPAQGSRLLLTAPLAQS